MVESVQMRRLQGKIALWQARLVARGSILILFALLLLLLLAFDQLAPLGLGIILLATFFAAAFLPVVAVPSQAQVEEGDLLDIAADWHLREFSDALVDPCLLLDRRGQIVHANKIAARDFPSARVGDPLAFSLRNPLVLSAFNEALRQASARSVELHQTVPHETWHKVTIAPLLPPAEAPAGEPQLFVMTLQSQTEQKRVDAMRADFVANASHELRTPLTSLMGFIDTLLGPAAKDAQAREKFLRIMRSQAERMSKLIDDLLSLGRIEMRQHVAPTDKVELSALISEVRDGLQIHAAEAGTQVELSVPDHPVIVTGDRDELYEVFENLLDNALKYGGDGSAVEVRLEEVTSRGGYDIAVSVTDHGPGIPAEHVPRLTERFYRVDAESSRKKKGTGLGLAIVKHIVGRHRGQLNLASRPGEGTRVEVLLKKQL